jgi:hypothetical protein
MRKKKILWIAPLAILGMIIFVWIGGQLVMHLWNWLVPELFGVRQVTFWQALGLLALCRILFGGLGLGGRRSNFRRRIDERWDHMTPEERDKIRQGLHGKWGCAEPPDPKSTA